MKDENFIDSYGVFDYKAYRESRINNGEICYKCYGPTFKSYKGKGLCGSCIQLTTSNDSEIHSTLIRCPHCGTTFEVGDNHELYNDGEHSVECINCDYEFSIITYVEFNFESPELLIKNNNNEDSEDENCIE